MNTQELKKTIDALRIQDVYLRDAQLRMRDDYDPALHPGHFTAQFRWSTKKYDFEVIANPDKPDEQVQLLKVYVGAALRMLESEPKDPKEDVAPDLVKAETEVTFIALYRVTSREDITQEGLSEFVQHNALYHVWPYWREYVQNTCMRSHLGNVVVPMLVMREKVPELATPIAQEVVEQKPEASE